MYENTMIFPSESKIDFNNNLNLDHVTLKSYISMRDIHGQLFGKTISNAKYVRGFV